MSMYGKAAVWGADFAEAAGKNSFLKPLNPITSFNKEQFRKLRTLAKANGMGDTLMSAGENYFAGKTIKGVNAAGTGIDYAQASAEEMRSLAFKRKTIAGGVAAVGAASVLGINPGGITDKLENLGALGGHYAVGSTLMGMGGRNKVAGIGYLGATAYNTLFNTGDNLGPM